LALSRPTLADWLSLLTLGLVWGGSFGFVTVALEGYGPVTVATGRAVLGAVALLSLAILLDRPLPLRNRTLWRHIVPIGVISSAVPFFLLGWGQQHVPSAFAGLSMSAVPLFVLPLAHFFADEPLERRRSTGFLIGFLGAVVLMLPGMTLAPDGLLDTLGRLACLGAACGYAVSSILLRRVPPMDPVALAALSLSVGAVVMVPAMLLTEGVPSWEGPRPALALIFLGLVPTGFAALLRVTVIRSAGPGFLTLVNYQIPLWAMAFGALFLGEVLEPRFFVALALIVAGLAITQWADLAGVIGRMRGPTRPPSS
jgi:drug/metabolite transporter (DMT)-like permease